MAETMEQPTGSSRFGSALIITARPQCSRGALLLAASEAETRIRFLPGFISAFIFYSEHDTVAVLVEWSDEASGHAAIASKTFKELLEGLQPYSADVTSICNTLIRAGQKYANPQLDGGKHGVLLIKSNELEEPAKQVASLLPDWALNPHATEALCSLLAQDPGHSHIGALVLGGVKPLAQRLLDPAQSGDHIDFLSEYHFVSAPSSTERPLDYRISVIGDLESPDHREGH